MPGSSNLPLGLEPLRGRPVSEWLGISEVRAAGRYRRDMGDLDDLVESICTVGLLHPIVVTRDYQLVAGARRLEALRRLGWPQVPVTVADSLDDAALALRAERDENTCRKEMTFSEMLPLKQALEEVERQHAAMRRAEALRAGRERVRNATDLGSGNFPQSGHLVSDDISLSDSDDVSEPPSARNAEARDVVAKALGVSDRTLRKVTEVHETANDPTVPEPVREVAKQAIEEMDRTGKVEPSHRKVRAAKAQIDPETERLALLRRLHASIGRTSKDLLSYDPEQVGPYLDGMALDAIEMLHEQIDEWATRIVKAARTPLTIVQGGQS